MTAAGATAAETTEQIEPAGRQGGAVEEFVAEVAALFADGSTAEAPLDYTAEARRLLSRIDACIRAEVAQRVGTALDMAATDKSRRRTIATHLLVRRIVGSVHAALQVDDDSRSAAVTFTPAGLASPCR